MVVFHQPLWKVCESQIGSFPQFSGFGFRAIGIIPSWSQSHHPPSHRNQVFHVWANPWAGRSFFNLSMASHSVPTESPCPNQYLVWASHTDFVQSLHGNVPATSKSAKPCACQNSRLTRAQWFTCVGPNSRPQPQSWKTPESCTWRCGNFNEAKTKPMTTIPVTHHHHHHHHHHHGGFDHLFFCKNGQASGFESFPSSLWSAWMKIYLRRHRSAVKVTSRWCFSYGVSNNNKPTLLSIPANQHWIKISSLRTPWLKIMADLLNLSSGYISLLDDISLQIIIEILKRLPWILEPWS